MFTFANSLGPHGFSKQLRKHVYSLCFVTDKRVKSSPLNVTNWYFLLRYFQVTFMVIVTEYICMHICTYLKMEKCCADPSITEIKQACSCQVFRSVCTWP